MVDFNKVFENAFKDKYEILKEIKCGLRCGTYLVKVRNKKYIFQIYLEDSIFQAKKKYNILNKFNSKFIPKAVKVEENQEYSYLITEYKEGASFRYCKKTDAKFSFSYISSELANVLGQIHSISNEKQFGWIDDKDIANHNKFIDYISSEYNRLSINLRQIDSRISNSILNKVKANIEIIKNKSKHITKSCLCWYDINPGNILIIKKGELYRLNALIDPGGARYGIPEWDIAFIKMQLCANKEEFNDFLTKYKKENPEITIDIEIVNALSVIVELDVISMEIEVNAIISQIPYDTSFRSEREKIHKKINEN